jgi:hypothetical protein
MSNIDTIADAPKQDSGYKESRVFSTPSLNDDEDMSDLPF